MQAPVGSSPTLDVLFSQDDVPLDLNAVPSVTVTRDDGTAVVSGTAVKVSGSTGRYTYQLPTTATGLLERLCVTWAGTGPGAVAYTRTTYVEVVTAYLFDVEELRALPNMDDPDAYPAARVAAVREWVDDRFRQYLGTSILPRWTRDEGHEDSLLTDHPDLGDVLRTSDPFPRQVRSLHLTDTAGATASISVSDLACAYPGVVYSKTRTSTLEPYEWVSAVLRYTAGAFLVTPGDLKDAALEAARTRLLRRDGQSGIPSNATSLTNDFGNVRLAQPDRDNPTGNPAVDAVLRTTRDRLMVAGL